MFLILIKSNKEREGHDFSSRSCPEQAKRAEGCRKAPTKIAAQAAEVCQRDTDEVWSGHSCPLPLTLMLLVVAAKNTEGAPSFASFAKEPALSEAEGWGPRSRSLGILRFSPCRIKNGKGTTSVVPQSK